MAKFIKINTLYKGFVEKNDFERGRYFKYTHPVQNDYHKNFIFRRLKYFIGDRRNHQEIRKTFRSSRGKRISG